eukprot:scaffold936_cov106-Amphora_coffeaeformis.AAC.3
MSDLAPFVAAAFQDQTVQEMCEAIARLRAENERLKSKEYYTQSKSRALEDVEPIVPVGTIVLTSVI